MESETLYMETLVRMKSSYTLRCMSLFVYAKVLNSFQPKLLEYYISNAFNLWARLMPPHETYELWFIQVERRHTIHLQNRPGCSLFMSFSFHFLCLVSLPFISFCFVSRRSTKLDYISENKFALNVLPCNEKWQIFEY